MILKPWLWLPSQLAHDVAPVVLPGLSRFVPKKEKVWRPFQWRGLHFQNPLGLAGGVDKTGRCLAAWARLGAGFLEVGTITPQPQGPNGGQIMDRDIANQALWNKMGFPNRGAEALARRLEHLKLDRTPLFINVGKNRWTDNADAPKDYSACVRLLAPFADAIVANLSSPNTEGLRDLLSEAELRGFLEKLTGQTMVHCPNMPILLKLSPDMDGETLAMALETSTKFIDGWILTNTTKQRSLKNHFPVDAGGVSGGPLRDLSRAALRVAADFKKSHPEKLLISVGGIDSAEEVQERLSMGADLVQVYSSLVFQGPLFFRRTLGHLKSQYPQ